MNDLYSPTLCLPNRNGCYEHFIEPEFVLVEPKRSLRMLHLPAFKIKQAGTPFLEFLLVHCAPAKDLYFSMLTWQNHIFARVFILYYDNPIKLFINQARFCIDGYFC